MQQSRVSTGLVAIVAVFTATLGTLTTAQEDPFVGTWVLNLDTSTFDPPGAPIESRTLTITANGETFTHTQDTFRQGEGNFRRTLGRISFDAKYDGTPALAIGSAYSHVTFTRMGRTLTRKALDNGVEIETATYTLSPDGRTLTIATSGNFQGVAYTNMQVFEKK
jgi:hypothetical protein